MLKLKKAALSLFGLAVMLICINPPQAHAGVMVRLADQYTRVRFTFVRIRTWRRALRGLRDRVLTPTGLYTFALASDTPATTGQG